LGAGLGAAGLASGFAASHFESVVGLGERVGEVGVGLIAVVELGAAWSVETMDCLLLLGGGAVL